MLSYVNLVVDIVIICALAATIFYSFRLSRQFTRLQADRKAFEQLIQALNVASARAEAAIRSLREAAMGAGDKLQEKIGAARALSGELEIMVQAGDNLAERLNTLAEKSRKAHTGPGEGRQGADPAASAESGPRSKAEKDLMEAVRSQQKS